MAIPFSEPNPYKTLQNKWVWSKSGPGMDLTMCSSEPALEGPAQARGRRWIFFGGAGRPGPQMDFFSRARPAGAAGGFFFGGADNPGKSEAGRGRRKGRQHAPFSVFFEKCFFNVIFQCYLLLVECCEYYMYQVLPVHVRVCILSNIMLNVVGTGSHCRIMYFVTVIKKYTLCI